MKYLAIALLLATLVLALVFPTLEGFIVGLENPNLPRKNRRRRNLLSPIVPRKITKKSKIPLFV